MLTAQYQGDLTLSSDQVLAFETPTATLRLSAVNPGDTATLLATRSTVQSETPQQLDVLAQLGLTDITATGGSLTFDAQQAIAAAGAGLTVSDASGAGVTDTSTALDSISSQIITGIGQAGFKGFTATSGSLTFDAQQAIAAAGAGLSVSAPSGAGVTDTSTALDSISSQIITGIGQAGFTTINSTDGSLQFNLYQATALADPIDISVPTETQ